MARIGKEGSPQREHSDGVLKTIVAPAAERLGMVAIRADEMDKPGVITTQIVEELLDAKMVVADLTGGNPNVYYEIAIRHSFRKPAALLAQEDEPLPFDTSTMSTILYARDRLTSIATARDKLETHMKRGLEGAVDSPIATAARLRVAEEDRRERKEIYEIARGLLSVRRDYEDLLDALEERGSEGRVPSHVLDALKTVDESLKGSVAQTPQLREMSDLLRRTVQELEASEPLPPLPAITPMDKIFEMLDRLGSEKEGDGPA